MVQGGSLCDRSKGGLIQPDHPGQRRPDHGQSPGAGWERLGGDRGGPLVGFVPGATVFACDLESAQGQRLWTRLVEGAPPGSARATPLGAVVEYVKRCRSLGEVKAACAALVSSGSQPAA